MLRYVAAEFSKGQSFILAAPTIALVSQIAGDLRALLTCSEDSRRVHEIHSGTCGVGSVMRTAATTVNAGGAAAQIVLVSTATCLELLPAIERRGDWGLILDESFQPVKFGTYFLSQEVDADTKYITEVCGVAGDGRLAISEGMEERARKIAVGNAGDRYLGLRELVGLARSSNCYLLEPEAFSRIQNGESVERLEYASFVGPEEFAGFREVVFMAALLEQSMLWHLWAKRYEVSFSRHSGIHGRIEIDTHAEQGPNVMIGHLLHPDDRASLYNLKRNAETGEADERLPGHRVIDSMVKIAGDFIQEMDVGRGIEAEPWLLQTNNGFGFEGQKGAPYRFIPAVSHGLNQFGGADSIAALAVTNPSPSQIKWLTSLIPGVSDDDVARAYRLHTIYQALGRCSVRDRESNEAKVMLVAGADDARSIHALFQGSTWLGQVWGAGGVKLRSYGSKEASKPEQVALLIVELLRQQPETTTVVRGVDIRTFVTGRGDFARMDISRGKQLAQAKLPDWTIQGHGFAKVEPSNCTTALEAF